MAKEDKNGALHSEKDGRFVSKEKPEDFADMSASELRERQLIYNTDGLRISGAISGALDSDSKEAKKHAERYYEEIRNRKNNAAVIAKNTGFPVKDIEAVRQYLFFDEHNLGTETRRLYEDYDMAQSWQRLSDGKNIQKHDITLIEHELYEMQLKKQGLSHKEAHDRANIKYNYKKELIEWKKKHGKP
ncbi:MAG: hypothetical protein IJW83_03975 [Clostridia bacterium]|nr:hypothetical protein [Clostridia bacterium]